LDFNVLFQHKYGYIRDEKHVGVSAVVAFAVQLACVDNMH